MVPTGSVWNSTDGRGSPASTYRSHSADPADGGVRQVGAVRLDGISHVEPRLA